MVAQILIILYNVVDRFYIGRIPVTGTVALGGVGVCFPLIILITGFTNMFGMVGTPLFSMAAGAGKKIWPGIYRTPPLFSSLSLR